MRKINYNREEIEQTIDRIVERTQRMDLMWDWPCGVAYYGIAEAYTATGKKLYIDFLKDRIDELINVGLPAWTVNTCAMGHSLLSIWQETGDEKYLEIIHSKIDYLRNEAPRFCNHVLQHTVSSNNDFPEQCWADTLFMAAFFMLRYGGMAKDNDVIEDALNQYYWHIQYLQDEKTGLWYHGYDNIRKDHMSGVYWGRANCWAAYTMSIVKHILPECYLYPQYQEIVGSLTEQFCALKIFQTDNGLWRTILDDQESYEELSASAGIAAAMILNENPLYNKYVEKSISGILAHVAPDGKVMDVSGGTAIMKDREGYRTISKKWTWGWGQGMALAFFAAVLMSDKRRDI